MNTICRGLMILVLLGLGLCESHAGTVRSRSGVSVNVAPSAVGPLQCVVDYVERAGVRIKVMRGTGSGSVKASLHPAGKALDINQTHRNRTSPHVPVRVANAAADKCGVISGARWRNADNGHWNLRDRGQNLYAGAK